MTPTLDEIRRVLGGEPIWEHIASWHRALGAAMVEVDRLERVIDGCRSVGMSVTTLQGTTSVTNTRAIKAEADRDRLGNERAATLTTEGVRATGRRSRREEGIMTPTLEEIRTLAARTVSVGKWVDEMEAAHIVRGAPVLLAEVDRLVAQRDAAAKALEDLVVWAMWHKARTKTVHMDEPNTVALTAARAVLAEVKP